MCLIVVVAIAIAIAVCERQIDPEIILYPHTHAQSREIVFWMRFIAFCSLYLYTFYRYIITFPFD